MKADEGGLVVLGGTGRELEPAMRAPSARGRDSDRDLTEPTEPREAETRIERRR